ncbi:MAG: fumarylacetoacetate hydrolase family protein [Saprospiraceae bacterium]|nr:fumarylacetoacetate hydrolase family protein [Saprospiraceae bacterium]
MFLFKYGPVGQEKCGVKWKGIAYDAAKLVQNYDESFFEQNGLSLLQTTLEQGDARLTPLEGIDQLRLGTPFARPSKIVCVGLNYAQHASESGMTIPPEPVLFFKSTTALCGPTDPLIIPKNSVKTDWEVELAFVIGKKASYVPESDAMDYVAGYVLHNDYSEREFQMERSGQWVKGKSADSFAPMGPFLATKDEIPDPHNLRLWLKVNGRMMQDSNTSDMVYKIPFLVHYISQFMTLLPGDVVSTGTPFGVGLGFDPPQYLKAGDVVELGIDGLGEQKQLAINHS